MYFNAPVERPKGPVSMTLSNMHRPQVSTKHLIGRMVTSFQRLDKRILESRAGCHHI